MNLRRLAGAAVVLALLGAPGLAAETRKAKLWRVSMVVLGGASVTDACFSWGKMEANPLLRTNDGRFGTRSVALKGSLVGAAMIFQWRLTRKDPKLTPYLATANLATAGILTGAAVRGFRTPR